MPPLSFTDDEMDSLTALASALPPAARDGFLRLVANKLSGYPSGARGPGLVHRLAAEAQRDLLNGGKYGRPYSVREDRKDRGIDAEQDDIIPANAAGAELAATARLLRALER